MRVWVNETDDGSTHSSCAAHTAAATLSPSHSSSRNCSTVMNRSVQVSFNFLLLCVGTVSEAVAASTCLQH